MLARNGLGVPLNLHAQAVGRRRDRLLQNLLRFGCSAWSSLIEQYGKPHHSNSRPKWRCCGTGHWLACWSGSIAISCNQSPSQWPFCSISLYYSQLWWIMWMSIIPSTWLTNVRDTMKQDCLSSLNLCACILRLYDSQMQERKWMEEYILRYAMHSEFKNWECSKR